MKTVTLAFLLLQTAVAVLLTIPLVIIFDNLLRPRLLITNIFACIAAATLAVVVATFTKQLFPGKKSDV